MAILATACGRVDFDPSPPRDATDATGATDATDATGDAAPRSFAFVQTKSKNAGAASAHSVAFDAPVVAGDLIVVAFDFDANTALTPILIGDMRASSYQLLGPFDNGTNHQYIAYAVATSSGIDSIAVALMGTSLSYLEVRIHEYAGAWPAAPLDQQIGANGASLAMDGARTPPLTTTRPEELIFGFFTFGGSGAPGTGFTQRSSLAGDVTEDELAVTPGPYTPTATMLSGSSYTGCAAAFFTR